MDTHIITRKTTGAIVTGVLVLGVFCLTVSLMDIFIPFRSYTDTKVLKNFTTEKDILKKGEYQEKRYAETECYQEDNPLCIAIIYSVNDEQLKEICDKLLSDKQECIDRPKIFELEENKIEVTIWKSAEDIGWNVRIMLL